ncbi:MAG: hypothetical protein GY711_30740 [bacterium]|nr:hypothetical protein [bacterium]
MIRAILAPFLLLISAVSVQGQAPDLAVSNVGGADGMGLLGQAGGVHAYSVAVTSCNVGDTPVSWSPPFDMPVTGQNAYRIVDGRIEMLGYSFLKAGFCAINEASCGTCEPTPCSSLGVGCASTNVATTMDGAFGWAKWPIDAARGAWSVLPPDPTGDPGPINGRLQIASAALGDPGSIYVVEIHHVSGHDHLAGLAQNNQSWRYVDLMQPAQPTLIGGTRMFEPAIFAWSDTHAGVMITEANILHEGGPGVHGHVWVGSRATELGGGQWRYDYAVQNQTSTRAIGSFRVSTPCPGTTVTNPRFFGLRHHSGSPYSNADWSVAQTVLDITWSTEDFGTNPNANALRWGTLYSYSFVANLPPVAVGVAELGLFAPGSPASVTAQVFVPTAGGFTRYCTATNNSTGAPARLTATGSPFIAASDIDLTVTSLPPSNFGYFLMSQTQDFVQSPPGSQGNLCLGGSIVRFSGDILNSGAAGVVSFHPDPLDLPGGTVWMPGDTWNFQFWTRDGQGPSNFSDGATIIFCQ